MAGNRPLSGVRVIEVATFVAGPYCGAVLAEFGADVIKVELPGVGDALRKFGTPSAHGDSLLWLSECRNKKCITLDIRTEEGAALFQRLIRNADVLVENFQPGTLDKWGLGWDVLHQLNERLVAVRLSGYGQSGPYRDRPGFGRIASAFGGLSFLAGDPDRPPVTPGSATIPDYLTGLYGALGALLALRSGVGQEVDIGLYEPVTRILDELASAYHMTGFVRQRMGAGTVNAVPHSHYPTKDGLWVAIACSNDKIFARLARAMGIENGKWATLAERERDRKIVDEYVGRWTTQFTREELLTLCEERQIPCGPVYAIDEMLQNPQYQARENYKTVDGVLIPNVLPRLSETPGGIDWLGPTLGQHNEEIYEGWLGLSRQETNGLKARNVI